MQLLPIKSLPSSILIKTRSSHKKLRRKGLQTISWNPVLQSLILAMSVCLFFITDIDLNTVFERCQKKSCNYAKQKRIHQIYCLMLLIHKSSSHAIIYTIAWFSCIRKHNHSMYKNHSLLHLIRTLLLSFVYALNAIYRQVYTTLPRKIKWFQKVPDRFSIYTAYRWFPTSYR